MDVSDASYYITNEKKKNKGSQMGYTKKYLKKKTLYCKNVSKTSPNIFSRKKKITPGMFY
jgi:hypothetical protein